MRDALQILEGAYFGDFYFNALKVLRNTMVMSVLTYNIEVAHNLTKHEIKCLDKIDIEMLQRALMTSSKVSRALILLDLGLVSVEYIIKQKRLGFLHHLLTSEESSISRRVMME